MSVALDNVSPAETALHHTVEEITAHMIGLGEGKLNLYVPSEAIIEPISPAEIVTEETTFVVSSYEAPEDETTSNPVQSVHSSDPDMLKEIISVNSSVSDSNPSEAAEGSAVMAAMAPSCDVSREDLTCNHPTSSGETEISKEQTRVRKFIPPKKDRMDPLKMDMSRPTVIPLTSSQLSLQCLECHIIFSDDRSKQRHLKMHHPTEYEQCMLGDALFACYVCDRHFTCSTELMAHQRTHTEKQPFKCPICGEAFSRSSELTSHKKVHYSKQGYTCSDCGKLFKTLTLLKYHKRVHTGERPYVCIHKECGKRFTMPKALQKHLEAHDKEATGGVENGTNATSKKKKRKKCPSSRKYACSQCKESFKTAKSQLHHIKTTHSPCSAITPPNTVMEAESQCLTTEVQLPLPCMEAISQGGQQIDALGIEHIKRLIEKMGNVQKVNQLVILGLDQVPLQGQTAGTQAPQGFIQSLHFDFTQSSVQQAVLQQAGDTEGNEGAKSSETEQEDTLLQSLEVEVPAEQRATVVQFETTISEECLEKQLTIVESDMTAAQVTEVQYELLPETTVKDILHSQINDGQLIVTINEQQIHGAAEVKMSETANDSSLSLITNFEGRGTSENELIMEPADITMSVKTNAHAELSKNVSHAADALQEPQVQTVQENIAVPDVTSTGPYPPSQNASEELGSVVQPEPETGQGNQDKLDKTKTSEYSSCQDSVEATDPLLNPQTNSVPDSSQTTEVQIEQTHLREIKSSEEQLIQVNKPPLGSVRHDLERSPLEQAPCSDHGIQQSRVETKDQTLLTEDSPNVKKSLAKKKQRSKKKVNPESQKIQEEIVTPNQTVCAASKTAKKPKEKAKKKCFGAKQKKKHKSKNGLYANQQDVDPGNVPVLSHKVTETFKQKHKKGKKIEKASGIVLKDPSEKKVMKVSEQAHGGKPQKRKFEKAKDLVKKGMSTQETQQDEAPVPKKKKPSKIPSAASQKKAKSNMTANNKVNKKSHKLTKQKGKGKTVSEPPAVDQIKQQALLLLKGHKQPQLKVHKLDAKTTGLDQQLVHKYQTTEIYSYETTVEMTKSSKMANKSLQAPSKKKKAKTVCKKSKVESKQSDRLQTPMKSDFPPGAKQKVVRKRKSPAKIDQEIALSPPYSLLIIGCHDCGKSFSEVSALQEHMASMHSENGARQSVVPCDVSEMPTVSLRPNDITLTSVAHSSGFEIHVPTDWDVDSEMREIGLGDEQRNDHMLSFPALNPSPSFQMPATFVEGEGKMDDPTDQEPAPKHKKATGKSSECHVGTKDTKISQHENMDVHSAVPVSSSEPQERAVVEEALPTDVNLVMIEDSHASPKLYNISQNSSQKVSDPQEGEERHNTHHSPSFIQSLPAKPVNAASASNAVSHVRAHSVVKQETDEISVQTVASQTNTSMTRGKRGRGNRGRGKRQLGKRRSAENRRREDTVDNDNDCQVVFELYSLAGSSEETNEETIKTTKNINTTETSIHSALEESSDVQEVCVLPQPVSTNGLDVMTSQNSSSTQTSGESDKTASFSSRLQKVKISVPSQSGVNGQGNVQSDNGAMSAGAPTDVKMESSLPIVTPHNDQANDTDLLQGVQMILVKAEDQQVSDDTYILQEAEHTHQEKELDHSTVGLSSGSPTVTQSAVKQCIFYPVKEEEEGEMLVESQDNSQGTPGPEESEKRTEPWDAPGLEERDMRIGCPQMEMNNNLYSSAEEGSVGAEQQNAEDILDFLSQTSEDMEEVDSVQSEPEAETHIMSCYHGIYVSGSARQCEMSSNEQRAEMSTRTGDSEADDQQSGSKENWEPIDYFTQYFSWDIWKDIAACTGQVTKFQKPVTEKEVSQFVGIHIAMGTLKFPSIKLYWDELTRVPLIADAMSAAMFSKLASNLRLASHKGYRPNGSEQDVHKDQDSNNCTEILLLKKDPLWKVQAIVNKVREGCQALKRHGNFGVDQYLLPFQRHPTHSLHHTVLINATGLVMDFSLRVNDCNREEMVEKMVEKMDKSANQGMVFLCKPELSTPSMLEHLLEAGVRSAGKVGGARGQIGDEFVTSDGKLKLFRCHHGFILSAVTKEKSRSTSLVSGFERAIKAANLNRDLRSLYRTPCTSTSPNSWPQSVLWDLIDLALVNSWLQYKQEQNHRSESLSLMAFRLDVSKALIAYSSIAVQDSSPPYLPPPIQPGSNASTGRSDVFETPLPDEATRYDGLGHWPEQVSEGEEARCRFGGCEQMSRVRCLKCCVFLCISRNHNCFLKFHSQGTA